MKITRRVLINLVTFAVVAIGLIGYGVFDLLGNPFAATTTVSTVLPSASGLAPQFSVAYDGIVVGSVSGITVVPGGAKVTMTIDPGQHVPAAVAARVVIANTLGQQEVELVPRTQKTSSTTATAATTISSSGGTIHPVPAAAVHRTDLYDGEVLPVAPDSAPAAIGTLVTEASKILDAIPPGDLNNLLHQAALAVNGQADNLKTIASASATFSQEFLAYQQQFRALLANSPPVLNTVTANGQAFQQGLASTASLLAELAARRGDLVDLLHVGSTASSDFNQVLLDNRANLGCLTHDFAAINSNLSEPTNLSNLGTFLQTNNQFFSIVQRVAPAGPARALTASDHARRHQVQLRVRLLFPPRTPPASQYSVPHGLTPIKPGAACNTEFGAGAPAVSQPGFTPAAGGTVVPASAAEGQVRGGGPVDPNPQTASAAADVRRAPVPPWPLAVAAAGSIGAMLVVGRRRGTRSAKAMRLTDRPEPAGSTGGRRRTSWQAPRPRTGKAPK